jgi:hypothetical protein
MGFVTRWGVVALVMVAAGCGADAPQRTLSAGDLRRITTVGPTTPGWSWPQAPIPADSPPPYESPLAKETPSATIPDPVEVTYDDQIAGAGGVVADDGSRWQDEQKLGVSYASLLNSATGAQTALAAQRTFAHGWAERTVGGGQFTDIPIEGLGDEAWRILSDFPGGQEVTYGWRRASLVMQVHIQCIFRSCPSDISLAARAWVDAIDKEAVDAIDNGARTSP